MLHAGYCRDRRPRRSAGGMTDTIAAILRVIAIFGATPMQVKEGLPATARFSERYDRTEPICYRKLAPGQMLPSLPPGGRWHFAAGKMTEGVPGSGVVTKGNRIPECKFSYRYSLSRLISFTKQSKNSVYFFAYCHYPLLPQSRFARQLSLRLGQRHGSDMPPACHSLPWRRFASLADLPEGA